MWAVKNLYFGYDENLIFEDANIKVNEKKVAIVGKNGVGKTTLLSILSGELVPQKGIVDLGEDAYYTKYNFTKYEKFTIRDFLMLIEKLESFDSTKSDYYVKLLGIEEYLDYRIGSLSKGTQKKVAILMTFLSRRNVLLIDEPFESIDEITNKNIINELIKINKKIIIVSHDFKYLQEVCEKMYEITNKGIKEYVRCV